MVEYFKGRNTELSTSGITALSQTFAALYYIPFQTGKYNNIFFVLIESSLRHIKFMEMFFIEKFIKKIFLNLPNVSPKEIDKSHLQRNNF